MNQSSPTKLRAADGRWEWQNYGDLHNRIQGTLNSRAKAVRYHPRALVTVNEREFALEAKRIQLQDAGPSPDVSIIVPVFNELKLTLECLISLSANTSGVSFEAIVANDASTDGTLQILENVPNLRFVNQSENVGFLRNCNEASSHARGQFLVFLNNDAQVTSGWLSALLKEIEQEPDIGAVGPKIVYPTGVLQEAGTRIRRNGTVEMIGLTDSPESLRWSYSRDIDYASGACLMVRTALFRELGGFSVDLAPAYCEDLDLCLRIRERGRRIRYAAGAEVIHHLSKTTDKLPGSAKLDLVTRNMQRLANRSQAAFDGLDDLRILAFYLPQFHPIPENDRWWGAGFTEWHNVGRARPNFPGHDQPRLPADFGYYDLSRPEVMASQWALAQRYGLSGFCYYYYWFQGRRLLERPLDRLLDATRPALPFCLCWANENWTRKWDGHDREILMEQRHTPEDDIAVINDMARYMRHPNYVRIRGRPVLIIYRTENFPAFKATATRWREECRRQGLGEIYLVTVETFRLAAAGKPPAKDGCDAALEFSAHYVPNIIKGRPTEMNPDYRGQSAAYEDVAHFYAVREHPGYKRFRCVLPGFDNTARRQNDGFCLKGATPGAFQAWLEAAIVETKRDFQGEERLLFVNAWNEWAEGAYLEPDRRFGHSYLEALRNARHSDFIQRDGGDRWRTER